jgi:hypothetical protein
VRIAVLHQLSKSCARPVAPDPQAESDRRADPLAPRLARCECRDCGAHSNAIVMTERHASCTNCGGPRLVPVDGACVIVCAQRQ